MSETKLLWTGYPWEVVIYDNIERENRQIFIDEGSALRIKTELKRGDIRFVDIAGDLFFWSDVKKVERIKVPQWLDDLLFKSGKITKKENIKKVLNEVTRLRKQGRKFYDEENVLNFLSFNQ